jgi:hypothetical protein
MGTPIKPSGSPKSSVSSGVKSAEYKAQFVKGEVPEKDVKAINAANNPKKAPGSVRK